MQSIMDVESQNEIHDFLSSSLDKISAEAYREGLERARDIVEAHPGVGRYCDTGEDMDWACRTDCAQNAVAAIDALIKKEV